MRRELQGNFRQTNTTWVPSLLYSVTTYLVCSKITALHKVFMIINAQNSRCGNKWVISLEKSASAYDANLGRKHHISMAGWPNGKALDYESRDCRFDPCVGQSFCFL
ncbi:hypothetical protein ACN38_g495 [Penicillium nordicum]|uniref:Uncharacterized protein n=1 Tax=Penicillium nordicum TaxID=229535 RepID=A0A0M9WKN1_9EURO|nr:hypothetical protein ACN38_g495 [Penicillium nordicum]